MTRTSFLLIMFILMQPAVATTHDFSWTKTTSEEDENVIILNGVDDSDFTLSVIIYNSQPKYIYFGVFNNLDNDDDKKILPLSVNGIEDRLKLADTVDDLLFYPISNIAFAHLMGAESFTLDVSGEKIIKTEKLKNSFKAATRKNIEVSGGKVAELAEIVVCHLETIYRRAAADNRLDGMSEEASLEAITEKLSQEGPLEPTNESLLRYANHDMYRIGETLFNDKDAREKLISMILKQCKDKKNKNGQRQSSLNKEQNAKSLISDSMLNIMGGSEGINSIDEEDLKIFADKYAECFLRKMQKYSQEYFELYVDNINETHSLLEARNQTVLDGIKQGISVNDDELKGLIRQCESVFTK
ncbi:hypothetical protein [Alteromonas hispanica]|uniref:Uncharacterized protein n=1 Tax=Alteromonas hispanica TaxID=315421 RepID=A0A6L9MPE7_9ALTE|nr:hypothetical protein [Alteromonas hispanica]NDW20008.1 hypothetical protein [Alteromonas hispanica]